MGGGRGGRKVRSWLLTLAPEARGPGARRGPDPPRPPPPPRWRHRAGPAPAIRCNWVTGAHHHRHAPVAAGPAEVGGKVSGGLHGPARLQGLRSFLGLHGLPATPGRGNQKDTAAGPGLRLDPVRFGGWLRPTCTRQAPGGRAQLQGLRVALGLRRRRAPLASAALISGACRRSSRRLPMSLLQGRAGRSGLIQRVARERFEGCCRSDSRVRSWSSSRWRDPRPPERRRRQGRICRGSGPPLISPRLGLSPHKGASACPLEGIGVSHLIQQRLLADPAALAFGRARAASSRCSAASPPPPRPSLAGPKGRGP